MKSLLLAVFLFTTGIGYTQNIGVGTKTPLSKLHVAGDLRVDSLAGHRHRGIVIHDSLGVIHSLELTGNRKDVLLGDGSFSTMANATLADASWLTLGNTGIDTAINFLGTNDKANLKFRVNKIPAGYLDYSNGNVAYGLNTNLSDGGWSNVAIGSNALRKNTVGRNMVAIGDSALFNQAADFTNTYANTAVGSKSLFTNTSGYYNVGIGKSALYLNTQGYHNTGTGSFSLYSNTTGYVNVASGYKALYSNTVGHSSTATGTEALYSNVNGYYNVANGMRALYSNTTGYFNTSLGAQSLYTNTKGLKNTATGYRALYSNISGSMNVAIGNYAMHFNDSGSHNVSVGHASLYNCKYGFGMVAIGDSAMFNHNEYPDQGWSGNVAVGFKALYANYGWDNVGIGKEAMLGADGHYNVAVGTMALRANGSKVSLFWNTAVGNEALTGIQKGDGNSAIGSGSMNSCNSCDHNTALGAYSLGALTSGQQNVAIGASSQGSATGSSNTTVGFESGKNLKGSQNSGLGFHALETNTTGLQNTAVGAFADVSTGTLINATAIGFNAKVNASNKIRLGNAAVTVIEGQVPFTSPSDGRFKFNVREDVRGLDFILRLRPVTYQFDVKRFDASMGSSANDNNVSQASYNEAASIRRTGFIAQEVEQAAAAAHYNFSGINTPANDSEHYSLSYESFVVPLVKAIQDQQVVIETLNERNQKQQKQIDLLFGEIQSLKKQIGKN